MSDNLRNEWQNDTIQIDKMTEGEKFYYFFMKKNDTVYTDRVIPRNEWQFEKSVTKWQREICAPRNEWQIKNWYMDQEMSDNLRNELQFKKWVTI